MAPAVARQRLLALLVGLACVALLSVLVERRAGDDGSGEAQLTASATLVGNPATRLVPASTEYGAPTVRPLPPESRIVGFAGAPQSPELGILGDIGLERGADRLAIQSRPYQRKTRPVTRIFDLIATVADAHEGRSGLYRTRQKPATIERWLRAARRNDALLMLDIQPGGSNFVDETRALYRWLKEPDVHLALDPEWRMRPGVAPGSEIGYVSHGELQVTLDRVAGLIKRAQLPPKLVVVHRFTDGMIKDLAKVKVPKGIIGVISIDGVGVKAEKIATYKRIAPHLPKPWRPGFKLFFQEDAAAGGLMSGKQVMALQPRPSVVLYE
ncbi:MAG: hypothetical protein J7513_05800 [Solirubrobacteraceae bacterium]|nr:hypothetical protein [Solirubrobacteraceae bacterium]